MGALGDFEIEAKGLHEKGQLIKKGVLEQLQGLPDNDKIKRLSPNCFIINSSDLSSENWTPQYYDFKGQYKDLSIFLDRRLPFQVAGALRKIIKEGSYTIQEYSLGSSWKNKVKLHPKVIEHLKTLL